VEENMKLEQYNELQQVHLTPEVVLKGSDLKNQSNRTLLWGYTSERHSWHVYLENGTIYKVVYGFGDEVLDMVDENEVATNGHYVPDKRLYPEACDFEFCELLKEREVNLPFTTFNAEREEAQFYGKTRHDLQRA
jgi:hypothetical protein